MTHTDNAPEPLHPRRVPVDDGAASLVLPGWDYADAFECRTAEGARGDAMAVARTLLAPSSSARRVLTLRDLAVRPVGLRPAGGSRAALLFPVLEESPQRVVTGLDDRHLDFRVIITVWPGAARCTTVGRRHGRLGRLYFSVVGPFHRRLVPRLLARCQGGWLLDAVAG